MAHEAKQYAQRNRQGSDWFSHDGNAVGAKPACPSPTETVAEPSEPPPVSEDVVDKSPAEESAPAAAPPQSARAQMIKPKCDSNEWFVLLLLLLLCSCCCCCSYVSDLYHFSDITTSLAYMITCDSEHFEQ